MRVAGVHAQRQRHQARVGSGAAVDDDRVDHLAGTFDEVEPNRDASGRIVRGAPRGDPRGGIAGPPIARFDAGACGSHGALGVDFTGREPCRGPDIRLRARTCSLNPDGADAEQRPRRYSCCATGPCEP